MRLVSEPADKRTDMEREAVAELAMEAMRLPGFVMLPGMRMLHRTFASLEDGRPEDSAWYVVAPRMGQSSPWFPDGYGDGEGIDVPDPDDPATTGCLLSLLGPVYKAREALAKQGAHTIAARLSASLMLSAELGRSCMEAAIELGRWPNLAERGPND